MTLIVRKFPVNQVLIGVLDAARAPQILKVSKGHKLHLKIKNKAKGQQKGTKREKKTKPCFWNPNIVAPKTIVKLKANVNTK